MKVMIGNFSVDNVKWFEDHEEMDIFKCDILYDGEIIGEFSEDYMNGPDIYDLDDNKMEQLRATANEFFKKYSKDDDLVKNRFSNNEDFLIRFLRNLNEAIEVGKNSKGLLISTSYPFEYDICNKINDKDNLVLETDNEYKMFFPIIPNEININLSNLKNEENHEII